MATNYPAGLDSFTTKTDGVDEVVAADVNNLQDAVAAIEAELGTDPAGSVTDVKTRLAVALNDDGTLKTPAVFADSATDAPMRVTARSSPPSNPSANDIYLDDGTNTASGNPGWRRYTGSAWEDITPAYPTTSVNFIIGSGSAAVPMGIAGYVQIPYACTIEEWTLLADQSGSIQIDIWKDTYANFPPTDADTITGGNEPALSSAQKNQDSTLTGWTTSISAGDILAINVDSATTVQQVTLALKLRRV
ncbi:hypothetical protein D6833_03605 [Candidatus Parcubacteria bacterium]|nr:MAG: hypothetical protein D6833_03605 [Candidatus Parcubacteria bacterium]